MSAARVLITGGGGQLASDLHAQLGTDAEVLAPSRTELDVTDEAAVRAAIDGLRPTVVYNCAAFHNGYGWVTDGAHFLLSHLLVQVSTLATLAPATVLFAWARGGDAYLDNAFEREAYGRDRARLS